MEIKITGDFDRYSPAYDKIEKNIGKKANFYITSKRIFYRQGYINNITEKALCFKSDKVGNEVIYLKPDLLIFIELLPEMPKKKNIETVLQKKEFSLK